MKFFKGFFFLSLFILIPLFMGSSLENSPLKQYNIKIKYLTPEVMDKNALLSYLNIFEGQMYSQKNIETKILHAKERLNAYGVFFDVKIFTQISQNTPDTMVVFIDLQSGWKNVFGAKPWHGYVARKNFLNRGDFIGGYAGINKNIFISLNHIIPRWLSVSQKSGWSWDIDVPYFPFFPLYGGWGQRYVHHIFSEGTLNFKAHSDIRLGLYGGVLVNLTNPLSTIGYSVEPRFDYKRTGMTAGGYLTIDQRFLREIYKAGYFLNIKGGMNMDPIGKTTFYPLNSEFIGFFYPHKFIRMIQRIRFMTQLGKTPEYLQLNINNLEFQRGMILNNNQGNFLFITNIDLLFQFYELQRGLGSFQLGGGFFYEASFAEDYQQLNSLSPKTFLLHQTIGAGLWLDFGTPLNIMIWLNAGYTVLNGFSFTVDVLFEKL